MKLIHIHPFPARMAPEIVFDKLKELPKDAIVLDPMSGSGTVLRAAAEMGHRCIGFDLDPLAVLMARVWTTAVDTDAIEAAAKKAIVEAKALRTTKLANVSECEETAKFISYWFEPKQADQLNRLSQVLARKSGAIADVLRVAMSRTIITKEKGASVARDTSHSRPHRVFFSNDYDVYAGFIQAAGRLASRLHFERVSGQAVVKLGDARNLSLIPESTVDAIITSPPYLNAIDYMRGHRLALVWLGHSIKELRQIRSSSIGSESSFGILDSKEIAEIVSSAGAIANLPPRERKMVSRYAIDIHSMMREISRILKRGGKAVVVVGNSCLKGIDISNAAINMAAGSKVGLKVSEIVERELPTTSRYLPPPTGKSGSALAKRMRTETILTLVA